MFVIENAIVKKDNTILGFKKRLEKISENEDAKYLSYVDKEILICEPTLAVTQMHNELVLYKQIYITLRLMLKKTRTAFSNMKIC